MSELSADTGIAADHEAIRERDATRERLAAAAYGAAAGGDEDALQEALLEMLRRGNLDTLDRDLDAFRRVIRSAVRQRTIDGYRQARVRAGLPARTVPLTGEPTAENRTRAGKVWDPHRAVGRGPSEPTSPDPLTLILEREDAAERRRHASEAAAAVQASLSANDLEVLALAVDGITPTQIGERLGLTPEAARQRLARARRRASHLAQPPGVTPPDDIRVEDDTNREEAA